MKLPKLEQLVEELSTKAKAAAKGEILELTSAQKKAVLKDFKKMSGGLEPQDAKNLINKYAKANELDLDSQVVKAYLLGFVK